MFTIERHTDKPTWLAARRGGIGGSDAGALWGASDYAKPYALWASKVRGESMEQEEDEIWQMLGHELEPALARIYGRLTGRGIRDLGAFTILRSTQWPWMTATLDRVAEAADRDSLGFVECKNRSAFGIWTQWQKDGLPADIWAQVQHGLAVTGFSWAAVSALLAGRYWSCEVPRDEDFIGAHVEKCRAFWHDHVLAGVEPERDGHKSTLEAVKSIYSRQTGGEVVLPVEADEWVDAIAAFKPAEEAKNQAEAELRIVMKEAAIGRLRSGRRIRLSAVQETGERKGYRRLTILKKGA